MGEEADLSLVKSNADVISLTDTPLSIGALERALLAIYRPSDADDWDRTGMLCGDPRDTVTHIVVALDATEHAVEVCKEIGANVLVTHHPAFLEPPERFGPSHAVYSAGGNVVYAAAKEGIALMNFHTALDYHQDARVLATMLGLTFNGYLEPHDPDSYRGYGLVCDLDASDRTETLRQFAARCVSVFKCVPRVWGDKDQAIQRVCIAQGSGGSFASKAVAAGMDCLVTGEIKYHVAREAMDAGLAIIDLGHDASELSLAMVLANTIRALGVPDERITIIDRGISWWTPEAVRV